MRHLGLPPRVENEIKTDDSDLKVEELIKAEELIKDEDLEVFDIKGDLMGLDVSLESDTDFPVYDKKDFGIDDDLIGDEVMVSNPAVKLITPNKLRNRRKALQPQRALTHSDPNLQISNGVDEAAAAGFEQELAEGEDDKEVESECIFKGLQEETEGEELDREMKRTVRQEWKAHWGVKCNMCEEIFTLKSQFDKHYRLNYNARPIYTCSYCSKTMEKYSTFRSHCYRHITEGRYKCSKCDKGFSLQSMLHIHFVAKHSEVKPFTCEECGKGFVTKPGLKIHLKKHRLGAREDYPCVECGKVLHTRGGLTAHMNVHRLGRRFMCDMCGKTFTQKVNMQQHVKHHNGERPHSCDKCGKRFAEKSHLARHYSFHSDKRPFKCDVCQKMYKTERCLKVHSMVHTSSRPYVCSYCNKGFLSSTKLKQHYNIHTGERPFKCKYCERTFTNYPNWLKHTRRRHKVDHRTGLNLVQQQQQKEEAILPDMSNYVLDYQDTFVKPQIDPVDPYLQNATNNVILPYLQEDSIQIPMDQPSQITFAFHEQILPNNLQLQMQPNL